MTKFSKMCIIFILAGFLILKPDFSYANDDEKPTNLNSETYVLIDADTGEILAQKGAHKKMYPASITKIVTAILAIESGEMNEDVTISKNAADTIGTSVYLLEGERMPLRQLVQGLLINSGNDAAVAIAEHVSGSVDSFADDMNAFVTNRLGLSDTHFVNPNGLFDEYHYTTASDMAKITQYALQNDDFRKIVGTKELPWIGKGWNTTLYNHNKLLWRYDGTFGVKNGYTRESQHTLVTAAKRNGTSLITVTMKSNTSNQAYKDTIKLMDYGFDHFETGKIKKGTIFKGKHGEEIKLKEDKVFTHKIGEAFDTSIDDGGNLVIENDQGEQLASFPIMPKLKSNIQQKSKSTIGSMKDKSASTAKLPYFLLSSVLLLLFLFIVFMVRKIKKRRRKKSRRQRMMAEINNIRYRD